MSACLYGDPYCPCQDGDACHYRQVGESLALQPPADWWHSALCGHPSNPVAWISPAMGAVCHCGVVLDVGSSTSFVQYYEVGTEWPLVLCSACGCSVAVPQEEE
jgi:hypothetical protein